MAASTRTALASRRRSTRLCLVVLIVAVFLGIALDTTVVTIGSDDDVRQQAFDPDAFGAEKFPEIRELVVDKAPDAVQLLAELTADKDAAVQEYGIMSGGFPIVTVVLTGTVATGKSGVFDITVPGMPEGQRIRVQTGPAINGTELRDIAGDISFGQFKNQIEYQDAGSGINRAMSSAILSELERDALEGVGVKIVGVFKLINPKNWLVTPVQFELLQ